MKINTEKLYIVLNPYPQIEDLEEIFVDQERNLADIRDLLEAINPEDFYGIYTSRASAKKDAEKLWKEVKRTNDNIDADNKRKKQFRAFVKGLEQLSSEHRIAVDSVGGVLFFDQPTSITYDEDYTSGDLIPYWEGKY